MNRSEKLSFIFKTGKQLRFYMDSVVMGGRGERPAICDDLSGIQMKTAMEVSQYQPMSLGELAANLGVSAPSASAMVERLVEKNVLTREPDPVDRRKIQLRIHPQAQADMEEIYARFHLAFDRIARQVGDETVDHWYKVMEKLHDVLKEERP